MQYEIVAEAYRDLEQASGRLALIDRLAALLARTPSELLGTVCYLCQGLIAPEFAGVDLGLAEKLALRAVATATGADPEQVAVSLRETGDLGQAAEQLLAVTAGDRPASLQVAVVVDTLHQIARAEGPGSQAASWSCWPACSPQATPLEARYLLRLVTGGLGWESEPFVPLSRSSTPVAVPPGRCWSALTTSAVTSAWLLLHSPAADWRRSNRSRCVPAIRCGSCSPSGCPTPLRSWPNWVANARPSTSTTVCGSRRTARQTAESSCSPAGWSASATSSRTSSRRSRRGLPRARRSWRRGRCLRPDRRGAAPVPGGHVPATQTRHRPGRAGRAGKPVLLRVAVRRRPGPHPTAVPATAGLLAGAITPSANLRLTTAAHVSTPTALDETFEQAVTDGCEGLLCKSVSPTAVYQAGARGWLWIKLKRDYRTELADTVDLVVVGAFAGRGRRRGLYGALLLAAYDPAADTFRTVGKCGTGFSDAEMAALPDRLAPLARSERPARVDARQPADVWFEPSLVLEVLSAELTLSPTTPAGDKSNPTRGWQCVPAVHRTLARRQNRPGRHHHPGTRRPVPHRTASTNGRLIGERLSCFLLAAVWRRTEAPSWFWSAARR